PTPAPDISTLSLHDALPICIPNLYRVTLDGGEVAQLTTVGTGLSGITNTSPALSVASSSGVAAFSVYEGGKYDIYTLDVARRGQDRKSTRLNSSHDQISYAV